MILDNRYGAFIDSELTVGRLGNGILDGMTFAVKMCMRSQGTALLQVIQIGCGATIPLQNMQQ